MLLSAEAETTTKADFLLFGLPVELGTFLAQLVVFLILLWLLKRFALKPLLAAMKKRQDHIENQLKEADRHRAEAERLLSEREAAMETSKQEAAEILNRARSISEKEASKLLEEARMEADRIRDKALSDIEREREKAIASLKDEVAHLSVMIAGHLIEKEIDEKTNRKIIDEYVNRVGGLQ